MPCITGHTPARIIPSAPLCGVRYTQMTSNTRRVMLQFYGSNILRCGKLKILLWLELISYHRIYIIIIFLAFLQLCCCRCRHGIFVIEPSISFGFPLCCFFNDCTHIHRAVEQSASNRNNFGWTPPALFVAGSSFPNAKFFDN